MRIIEFFLFFILCVTIAVFAAHNTGYVPINLYPFGIELEISGYFLFFISLVFGAILSSFVYIGKIIHYKRIIRSKDKEIEALKKNQTTLDTIKP